MLTQTYEDGDTVTYTYDNDGALAEVYDSVTGITTRYYYDLTGRQMKYTENGTGYSHSVGYEYDTRNNLSRLVEYINGTERTTTYTYDDDNRIKTSATGDITVEYTYDDLGRVATQTTRNGSTVMLTESYTYKSPTNTTASSQIAGYTTAVPNGYTVTYSCTYDDNGNITGVSDGTNTITYVYDSANQLIRENNQAGGFTYTWTYDNAGNILTRKEYAYTTGSLESQTPTDTVSYTYGNGDWGDLLTAYDGSSITYDGIGNTLNDGEWTYTWEHGRQLAGMSKAGTTWTYTYNADGLRTKRTNGTTAYSYTYNGGSLSQMTVGTDTLNFAYDANGIPLAVTYNGATYYYVTNLQGDVVAILDSTGTAVVSYTYDAWGNILSTTGSMASTLGTLNPLRYRGYIYDTETGLYYVSSRYYDPEIGRWINMDNFISTGLGIVGYNAFAYCNNNPILLVDENGEFPWLAVGIVAVCVIAGGIWGFTRDSMLGSQEPEVTSSANTTPPQASDDVGPWKPPSNTKPPQVQNKPGKEKKEPSTAGGNNIEELSINDRIENMFIGAGMGLAVGGAITSVVGAVGSVAAGSASVYIGVFGGTGAQTFSIGALAYDLFAMIVAPFFGVEMETIEIEP